MKTTDLAVAVVIRRGFCVKAVATTHRVSRSELHMRSQDRGRSRRRYAKANDGEFLSLVRSLVHERPTYDYRRLGTLLDRQRGGLGFQQFNQSHRLNQKRI
jgi:hypothetical protein